MRKIIFLITSIICFIIAWCLGYQAIMFEVADDGWNTYLAIPAFLAFNSCGAWFIYVSNAPLCGHERMLRSALRDLLGDVEGYNCDRAAFGMPVEHEEHPFHESVMTARAALNA